MVFQHRGSGRSTLTLASSVTLADAAALDNVLTFGRRLFDTVVFQKSHSKIMSRSRQLHLVLPTHSLHPVSLLNAG